MKLTAKIEGGKEVAAMLQRADERIRRKLMRDTIKRNAKPVLEEARRAAPNDTGALRRALVVRVWSRERQGYYFASVVINSKVYRSHRMARGYKPDWVERYYRWTITGATIGKSDPVTIPPNPYPDTVSERQFERYRNGVLTDLRSAIKEATS